MERLLIIGNGMATARLLKELVDGGCQFRVTVIGDEPRHAYNRILLSRLLSREIAGTDLQLLPESWLAEHNIEVITGVAVDEIDRNSKTALLANGDTVQYDQLILATGARSIMPALPGMEGPHVHQFRTWQDCEELESLGDQQKNVIVAGGGLLGIEAACGLAELGAQVTVVHSGQWPLNRQLDRAAGHLLAEALEHRGIRLMLGQRCASVLRDDDACLHGATLEDGTVLHGDAIVFAIGITPNDALARNAGLPVDHGICVDGHLRSEDKSIYALGECARVCGENVGLMEPVNQHAAILAGVLNGKDPDPWAPTPTPTRLKVTGEEVFSSGVLDDDSAEEIAFSDPVSQTYRKLIIKGQKLIGAVLLGDTSDGNWYHQLIINGDSIQSVRQQLVFGQLASENIS